MKTIQFITESVKQMQKLKIPAQIKIGTFEVDATGSLSNWAGRQGEFSSCRIKFRLEFRPDHIQKLLDMGVKIDLENCVMAGLSENAKRFKKGREAIRQGRYAPYYHMGDPNNYQKGVIENWLHATAYCSADTLQNLDIFCRENHRNQLAIHNDHQLRAGGWKLKTKYSRFIEIESQYKNIKAIRRTAHGKPTESLLPIQKRVLKLA